MSATHLEKAYVNNNQFEQYLVLFHIWEFLIYIRHECFATVLWMIVVCMYWHEK